MNKADKSESFKDWHKVNHDKEWVERHDYAQSAWNHQQEKIDELKETDRERLEYMRKFESLWAKKYEEKCKKLQAERDKVALLREKLKIRDSYIINFIENWNYLRGVLSNVSEEENREFVEAKEFSEAFAMNTFREWLDIEKTEYQIKTLEEHEDFKDIFWTGKLKECEGKE